MQKSDKKFVYHRALNTQKSFEDFLSIHAISEHTLVAEGDVCWAYIDNAFIIYIHHPDIHGKSLSNEVILELSKRDELFTLEKLFKINSSVHFILELKTGNGNLEDFFREFRDILQKYDVQNAIIDAFSLEQLKLSKKIMPHMKTSLHTKFIFGTYVFETTFEKPYFRIHKIENLQAVDCITISYATTHVKLLNLNIDKAYKTVYKSKKTLNLGSIKSLDAFDAALASKCEYIYLRSDEVLNGYTNKLQNKTT